MDKYSMKEREDVEFRRVVREHRRLLRECEKESRRGMRRLLNPLSYGVEWYPAEDVHYNDAVPVEYTRMEIKSTFRPGRGFVGPFPNSPYLFEDMPFDYKDYASRAVNNPEEARRECHFQAWVRRKALEFWKKDLTAEARRLLNVLGRQQFSASGQLGGLTAFREQLEAILARVDQEAIVNTLHAFVDVLRRAIDSRHAAVITASPRRVLSVASCYRRSRSRSRARRSPARSAAKSGGDGGSGEDGDSDQGEPPGPLSAWTVDILHRLLLDGRCVR